MNKEDKIAKLKEQLIAEVQKENADNNIILSLSSRIANSDEGLIRFSIDAGVIDRLGKELVARQETAVSELVKNAYDADSREVMLTFINSNDLNGTLKIQDDGDGMTRNELVNGFMRISSTDKIHNPYSRKFNRKRAGQKGIGRFAVQRLGKQLTIITQTENSDSALKLSINWEDYQGDYDLNSVSNKLEVIPKGRVKGTTLIIENLRDKWPIGAVQRIYGYVTDIIQPFPLAVKVSPIDLGGKNKVVDPGFKSIFVKVEGNETKTVADDRLMIYNHALATIDGSIDDLGIGNYHIESPKLNVQDSGKIGNNPDDPNAPFTLLKNIHFRAYYFNYADDLIPKMHKTSIQNLASKSGGIRLYRNGFRVLPYGEPGDDWLKLDKSVRERVILPPHGNNNFFGFVEIDDTEDVFNETSSREGLMESEAFIQLKNFVYRTIITGMLKVNEPREKKLLSNQKKDEEGNWEKIEFRIKDIAHTVEELDKELENDGSNIETKTRRKKKVKKLKEDLLELERIQKSEQEKYLKERSMLRVLSSVGLTIAQFIHEIKYYLNNIQSDIRFLIVKLQHDKSVLERVMILDNNFASFHTYTSYFDDVVSQNVIRELKPLDLRAIVNPFIKSIAEDALKSGVKFVEPVFTKYRLFTKPMHPSEWSSILFNFYTNSKKAIKRANVEGKILIECGEIEGFVYLEFSDNGDGISKENEEKVFEEFFTTTSSDSFDNLRKSTDILGTGLGLKIVKDIVNSYRGNVRVVSAKSDYTTCFRVEIPMATEKDIIKYDL